ncbi:LysR family transcriptional regulator [Caldimonas brevitalea]|nr:LysR family transcriptional regulator [Caldimonas brevitalea]
MHVFTKVVDLGALTKAAESLGLSSAAVSRTVAGLEAQLGVRLLQRTTRSVALTPAGGVYLERARRILREVDAADATVAALVAEPKGKLRVLAPSSFVVHQLARQLPVFVARYPDVSIDVVAGDCDLEADSAYDVSIQVAGVGGSILRDDVVARPLAQVHCLPCAAPGYLERCGPVEHPTDLLQRDCLVFATSGMPPVWRFEGAADVVEIEPRAALRSDHGESLYAAALAELGIATLPTFMVHDALQRNSLVRVLPQWRIAPQTIYAVLPTYRYIPASTRAFVQFLTTTFGGPDHDPWLAAATTRGSTPAVSHDGAGTAFGKRVRHSAARRR